MGAEDIYKIYKHMGELQAEQVVLCIVSKKRSLISSYIIGIGSSTESVIDTETVNKQIISSSPNDSICLVHNHPSDDAVPSKEDIAMTDYIKKVCELLGRKFLDHVIIAEEQYYSFNTGVRTVYASGNN